MTGSNRHFLCFLTVVLLLQCSLIAAVKNRPQAESKTAYAIYDDNGEEFIIVHQEPPRDKYVAGATFSNSINQTG